MNIQNLILTFLAFFKKRGYEIRVNNNVTQHYQGDLLFINSGVAGIFNEFMFEKINKLATLQLCLRLDGKHNDYDNIGNSKTHLSCFYMLGTFANNNAELKVIIKDIYDFLNIIFNLENTIYVTVHPEDKVSPVIWEQIDSRIPIKQDVNNIWKLKNTGPYGYCTEIIYNADGQELEIWNIVIVDRIRQEDGNDKMLKTIKIDTGGGLERIYAIFEDISDVYFSKHNLHFMNNMLNYISLVDAKIILDAIKSINSLLNSNVVIANIKHGYILKKIVRRLIFIVINNKDLNLFNILYYGSVFIDKINEFIYIYRNEYSAIKKCNEILNKYVHNKEFSVSEIAKLHNTYGVHYHYILDFAKNNNIATPDVSQIESEIYLPNTFVKKKNINSSIQNSEFLYEGSSLQIHNFDIFDLDFNAITEISPDQHFILITEKTVFYPEGGGQAFDTGFIVNHNITICSIYKTIRMNKLILHYCSMLLDKKIKADYLRQGSLIINSQRRHILACSHTMHHIILATIELILKEKVFQQSSKIQQDKSFVTFYSVNKLVNIVSTEQLSAYINDFIQNNDIHINIKYININNAVKQEYKMLLCAYNNTVRAVEITINDKIFSKELCGGTHQIDKNLKVVIDNIINVSSYNTKVVFRLV